MSLLVSLGIVFGGLLIIVSILRAIVRKKITETHGLFWLICAFVIVIGGASPDLVILLASKLGVEYAPAVIFTFAIMMLFYLMFRCTMWISELTMRVQELGMQVSLLNQENLNLMAQMSDMQQAQEKERAS